MIGNVPEIHVFVREWPFDYESLLPYVCGHYPFHQPLKSDDLICGAVVKDSDSSYQVFLCRSLFEKFDKESR